MKKIISFLITALAGYVTYYFYTNSETVYAVVACVVAFLFLYIFISSLFEKKDPYQAKLDKILKTYDSVLVEIECLPKVSDKKIVTTKYFKDLVNVQFEVRKPIYYLKDALFCDFLVIGNDTTYVYTLKRDKSYKSNLEELLEKGDNKEILEEVVAEESVKETVKENIEKTDTEETKTEEKVEEKVGEEPSVEEEKNEDVKEEANDVPKEEIKENTLENKEEESTLEEKNDDEEQKIDEKSNDEESATSSEPEKLEDLSDEDLDKRIEELKNELKKFSE